MKTILHVIPSLTGGGAERQLALLAHQQAKRWNVHVAVRSRGNYERYLGSDVVVHELGDLRRGHPLLFVRVDSLVRRLRPDLLQTWLLQMDIVGGAIALKARVPWILTERNTRYSYAEFPVASRVRYQLGRHARAIVANSTEGADQWRQLRPRANAITTIRNAIDTLGIAAAMPRSLVSDDRPVFLAVGRLVPQKAHDVLLEAAALIPSHQPLLVAILGDGALRAELEYKIRSLALGGRVRLLPYHEDWWGLLKTATGLINASRYEGQPNVVLEAMAAGCPLIVSDIGPHHEFLDPASALFMPPDDPRALATAMLDCVRSRETASVRAHRASTLARGATPEAAARAYDELYAQVIGAG